MRTDLTLKQNQDPLTRVSRAGEYAREASSTPSRAKAARDGEPRSLAQDDNRNKNKHRARLLAIDIDGTLLDSSYRIPAENLAALRRAHEAGVEMVLVTWRRHAFAMPV